MRSVSTTIDFLNVGHGDCTVIEHDSRLTMVDVSNARTPEGNEIPEEPEWDEIKALAAARGISTVDILVKAKLAKFGWDEYYRSLLVDPYAWFNNEYSGRTVHRYVQTHPDMDHMQGLAQFFLWESVELINFWDVANNKEIAKEDCDGSPYDYVDWIAYQALRRGQVLKNDEFVDSHKVLKLLAGAEADFYTPDGITILNPTQEVIDSANSKGTTNDLSYILRLDYAGRRVILAGDAESGAWTSVLENWSSAELKCDILKAAHHGRLSGFHEEAVKAMEPEVVICSIGKYPSSYAKDKYEALGATVYSTRFHGSIRARLWYDGDIWVSNHKGDRIHTL